MARVQMASQAWGLVIDTSGNALTGATVTLKNLDGTNATHWSAVTGGSSLTSTLTTGLDGTVPRYIETGTYTMTVSGTTRRVEATAGTDGVKAFGATGDGTTNDTVAIQAAIDYVWGTGGGTVNFPAGVYRCQGVKMRAGVWLRGVGAGQDLSNSQSRATTTLKCIDSPTADVAVLYADPDITGSRFNGGGIADIAIWGPSDSVANRPTVAGGGVPQVDGVSFATVPAGTWLTHWQMRFCRVYGFRRGVHLGGGSGVIRYVPITGTYISNCETGMVIDSGHPKITHSRFRYCDTAIDAHCEDWQCVDNAFGQCNYGIVSTGSFYMERNAFAGNIFYGIQYTALDIGSGCIVMGNVFRGLGDSLTADETGDPSTVGPLVKVRTRNNTIVGNRFFGNHSGPAIQFAPASGSTQTTNIVSHNAVFIDVGRFIEVGDSGTLSGLQVLGNSAVITSAGDGLGGMFLFANSGVAGVVSSPMIHGNNIRVETTQLQPLVDVRVSANSDGPSVQGNRVTASNASVPGVFYFTGASQTDGQFLGNKFKTAGTGSYTAAAISTATLTGTIIKNNVGYKTENSGTATVLSGTTSIAVSHGLDITPLTSSISVTPTNNLGTATKFWVSNVTSTQFTINVDANPGATTATFQWNISSHRLI